MASCTADLIEYGLAEKICALDGPVVRNHPPRDRQRGLIYGNRSQIGCGQLVDNAIAIRIGVEPKAFLGLHAVMMIECVVAELPE